jgi:hypothetical protein
VSLPNTKSQQPLLQNKAENPLVGSLPFSAFSHLVEIAKAIAGRFDATQTDPMTAMTAMTGDHGDS